MSDDLQELPGRGLKPITSLLSHRRLAVITFFVVLVLGLPFAWIKGTAHYQTEAALQVAPRYMRNLREDQELDFQSNTQYRQFVEQMRQSVTRYDVLQEALQRLGDKRSLWQKPKETERRAIERLRDKLVVAAVPDTYLMRINLEGTKPEGLAEIVNSVATTFIEKMKSEEIYRSDDRAKNLQVRETQLLALIAEKGSQRNEIARDLSLTTFAEGTPNPYDLLVSSQRGKLADARQARMQADAALAAFKNRGDATMASKSVVEAVQTDPGLNSLKASLANRRAALLIQKSGLKPDHPGAVAANRELREIDAELRHHAEQLDREMRANLLARLQGSADQARAVEQGLEADLVELEAQATRFARLFQDAKTLTADIAQARDELNKVRERINFIGVESTSQGFLRLVTPALVPDLPFGAGRKKMAIMVLLAALVASLITPMVRDILDKRVRTVNDAHRLMGIAPAGWQVLREDTASHVFADEQLRRMAATLIRTREKLGRPLFGFTDCKPGGGTTTLILELANTLQALGYHVLVVEANGFSRDPRYRTGRPGLFDLLRGHADSSAVQAPATADLPPRVAVGGGNERMPLERLDRLQSALQDWSAQADFVLVDMPPLLVSADAELLVRMVGQVLLVIEAGAVTAGEVTRARRLLQTLDPEAVGVVVNRIAPFDGGGYLRELMLESLTGRRADTIYTLPYWKLVLSALALRFKRPFR